MNIILNGQAIETQQESLESLLSEQGYAELTVATALNQQFIAATDRDKTKLEPGCTVDVVAPMQGG